MSRPHCDCHGFAIFADGTDCEACNARSVFRECGHCDAAFDTAEQAKAAGFTWDAFARCNSCAKCTQLIADDNAKMEAIEARRQLNVASRTERKAS